MAPLSYRAPVEIACTQTRELQRTAKRRRLAGDSASYPIEMPVGDDRFWFSRDRLSVRASETQSAEDFEVRWCWNLEA